MISDKYYSYEDNHIGYPARELWGFSKEAILKNNTEERTFETGSYEEKDSGSKNDSNSGWITPMEFYQQNLEINESPSVQNGMVTKKDINSVYRNLYWWCEDLHNWCVYNVDCVSDEYCNYFYLLVWNGKNGWEPLGMREFDKEVQNDYPNVSNKFISVNENISTRNTVWQNWRGWQNKILYNIAKNNNTIIQHRGSSEELKFSTGPLNVVNAFVLQKADRFSVNSSSNFQTIRWSSSKHIENNVEFIYADAIFRTKTSTTKRKLLIKFRQSFLEKNYDNLDQLADNFTYHPFIQMHHFNTVNSSTADSSTFKDYKIIYDQKLEDDKLVPGKDHCKFKKQNYSHSTPYRSWNQINCYVDNIYDNYYTGSYKGKGSMDDKDLYFATLDGVKYRISHYTDNDVIPYTPLCYRFSKGNYYSFSQFAQEKIFAVYILNEDGTFPKSEDYSFGCENFWYNEDVTSVNASNRKTVYVAGPGTRGYKLYKSNEDELIDGDNRLAPIYMSYIDLEFIFHKLWNLQGRLEFPNYLDKQNLFISDCQTLTLERWINTNSIMLQKLAYMLYPEMFTEFNENKEKLKTIAHTAIVGQCDIDFPFNIFYNYIKESHNKFGFIRLWPVCDPGSRGKGISGRDNNSELVPAYSIHNYKIEIENNELVLEDIKSNLNMTVYIYYSNKTDGDAPFVSDANTIYIKYGDGADKLKFYQYTINDLIYTQNLHIFDNYGYLTPPVSNYREGISIGNPAIWRLPTGEVALCAIMMWGGKNRLIGGPGDWNTNVIAANTWVNQIAQDYFGRGQEKTIDKDWLKEGEELIEKDQTGDVIEVLTKSTLESGKIFEQINKVSTYSLGLTLTTYRPNIYTDSEHDNIDLAKKW